MIRFVSHYGQTWFRAEISQINQQSASTFFAIKCSANFQVQWLTQLFFGAWFLCFCFKAQFDKQNKHRHDWHLKFKEKKIKFGLQFFISIFIFSDKQIWPNLLSMFCFLKQIKNYADFCYFDFPIFCNVKIFNKKIRLSQTFFFTKRKNLKKIFFCTFGNQFFFQFFLMAKRAKKSIGFCFV